jgi:hypothetical protein
MCKEKSGNPDAEENHGPEQNEWVSNGPIERTLFLFQVVAVVFQVVVAVVFKSLLLSFFKSLLSTPDVTRPDASPSTPRRPTKKVSTLPAAVEADLQLLSRLKIADDDADSVRIF